MKATFGIEDLEWQPISQQTGAVLPSRHTFNNLEVLIDWWSTTSAAPGPLSL
jgi:hypothetical protein